MCAYSPQVRKIWNYGLDHKILSLKTEKIMVGRWEIGRLQMAGGGGANPDARLGYAIDARLGYAYLFNNRHLLFACFTRFFEVKNFIVFLNFDKCLFFLRLYYFTFVGVRRKD